MLTADTSAVERTTAFLDAIGIPTLARAGAKGFLDAIDIVDGTLHYDPQGVRSSDLLHEAGHLAVIPSEWRGRANGDLDIVFKEMCEDAFSRFEVDSPELRAVMQSGEAEATAWSYAAGVAIGLDPDDIIHPDDYDGEGETVRLQLSFSSHFGVHGLRHGGMIESVRTYPAMLRWLQA